eukprot:1091145-Rhodomonas_salina.2
MKATVADTNSEVTPLKGFAGSNGKDKQRPANWKVSGRSSRLWFLWKWWWELCEGSQKKPNVVANKQSFGGELTLRGS